MILDIWLFSWTFWNRLKWAMCWFTWNHLESPLLSARRGSQGLYESASQQWPHMSCRSGQCSAVHLYHDAQIHCLSAALNVLSCLPKTESRHLTALQACSPAFFSVNTFLTLLFFSLYGFSHALLLYDLDSLKRFFYIFHFQQCASIFIYLFYNVNHSLMKMYHSILTDSGFHLISSFHFDGTNRLGISWDFNNWVINKEIKLLKQERDLGRHEKLQKWSLSSTSLSDSHCIV